MIKTHVHLRPTVVLLLIGIAYGYSSALHNQNPYYPVPKTAVPKEFWFELADCNYWASSASHWQPSPVWLPSYVLCKMPPGELGSGIFHSKSGYLFRTTGHFILYRVVSTLPGGGMALGIGVFILWIRDKKRAQD